jgi:molybdenum cofactor cytidylyltransferase
MIVGVVLAAGASSRMGSPKALLRMGDMSLVEHHMVALLPICEEVVVVVGAHRSEIAALCNRERVKVIVNEKWESSDALESLRVGISGFSAVDCVVVTPVDIPPVSPADLRALVSETPPAVLSWQGASGHPVMIGKSEVEHIISNDVNGGLRSLLGRARSVPAETGDILCNLNTPELWSKYLDEVSRRK